MNAFLLIFQSCLVPLVQISLMLEIMKRQKQLLHQIFQLDLRAALEKGVSANLTRNYCNEFGNSIPKFCFLLKNFHFRLEWKIPEDAIFGSAVADWEQTKSVFH